MSGDSWSRRKVVGTLGAGIVGSVTSGTASGRQDRSSGYNGVSYEMTSTSGFETVSSFSSSNLNTVSMSAVGPYAAGGGGLIARRRSDGWEKLTTNGIQGLGKTIIDSTVSDDGRLFWVCGGSGTVGYVDTFTGATYNFSNPDGLTTTFETIEVDGTAKGGTVGVGDTSGNYVTGFLCDKEMTWGSMRTPSGGDAIYGISFSTDGGGALVGSSGNTFTTDDAGRTWSGDGISNFGGTLNSVVSDKNQDTIAVGNSGIVARKSSESWSTSSIAGTSLKSISRVNDELVAVGGSGKLFVYESGSWSEKSTGTSKTLRGVTVDSQDEYTDTAVGKSGTVLERGSFSGLPNEFSIHLDTSPGVDVSYELTVDGTIQKGPGADSSDSISGGTATGAVNGSDRYDDYQFSGNIVGFSLTGGTRSDVTISVNDVEVAPTQLKSTTWTRVSDGATPTSKTLHSIVESNQGLFTVGGGGVVLQRKSGSWETVVSNGPAGNGSTLYTTTASSDGEHVWFGGASGALGMVDTSDGSVTDHTAPSNVSNTMKSVAVLGDSTAETVILGTGSGQIIRGERSSGISWSDPFKPGSGSSIRGIHFVDHRVGYLCDGNGDVFRTQDAGKSWNKFGLSTAPGSPQDISVRENGDVLVAAGSGYGYRYSDETWSPFTLGGNTRYAVVTDGAQRIVVGSAGQIYVRKPLGWKQTADIGSYTIRGATIPEEASELGVAVGEGGTIVYQE